MKAPLTIPTLLVASLMLMCASDVFAQRQRKGKKPRIRPCATEIETVLKDSIFKHSFTGIKIVSLRSGKTLYQQNSDKLFRPASNLKLFTTTTALALLGKNFQYKTEVYADSVRNGIVRGSLYLKGYGDPLLTSEHLDSLVRMIYRQGVREIRGDLVGDASYFDDTFWGKGWMWDDDPGYFWPYLTPLTVNRNTVSVTATPGIIEGDSVQVALSPATSYVTVVNRAFTSSDTARKLTISRLWKERLNTITVDGTMRPGSNPTSNDLNVWKPEFYTLTILKEKLLANGISVRGALRLDTVRNSQPLAFINHPLDSVIVFINKESSNLGAEYLLKTLGAELKGTPGNADSGIAVMKSYLATMGIDTSAIVFADGSGVSRYNLVTPEAIIKLLIAHRRDPFLFETIWKSLPIAGVDGTLKNRMTNGPAMGNARAKTGNHSDVTALSGFVVNAKGDTLVFSILMNHFPNNSELYRKAQDRIVEILTNCK